MSKHERIIDSKYEALVAQVILNLALDNQLSDFNNGAIWAAKDLINHNYDRWLAKARDTSTP